MGLEAVELILNLEEKLQIAFEDAALERIRTVDDLTEYIRETAAVLPADVPPPCISSIAFFRLRAAVTAIAPEKRTRFRPAMKFREVFSAEETRRLWPKIAELSRLRLPRLVRRRTIVLMAAVAVMIVTTIIARGLTQPLALLPDDRFLLSAFLFLVLVGPVGWLAARLTRHLKYVPESHPQTMGDLVHSIVESNIGPLRRELGMPFTKEEVFEIVRRELVVVTGCDADEVRPEARLVKDLGLS